MVCGGRFSAVFDEADALSPTKGIGGGDWGKAA